MFLSAGMGVVKAILPENFLRLAGDDQWASRIKEPSHS